VLDGTLMIGTRLLEHFVEQVGPSRRLPGVPVFGSGDKICVGGVAFRLRLLLTLLLRAALGGLLRDVFLRAPLRLLVLPEDGLDRLLARGELGGDVHQLARPGGGLAPSLLTRSRQVVPARNAPMTSESVMLGSRYAASRIAGCSPVGTLPAAGGSFGDPRSSQDARMCPGSFRRRL
jgi:hypothetical protein